MRRRFAMCRHCGDIHQYGLWPDNCKDNGPARSDLPAPYIQSDHLPGGIHGMLSHADGRIYDSKAAYYKSVRAAGCEIVANDKSMKYEALVERDVHRGPSDTEIRDAYIQARETLTSDNISNDEMHNMLRAQVPAEEIVPNA